MPNAGGSRPWTISLLHSDPQHSKFYDQLSKAWNRPAIIEGQQLWDDLIKAQSNVMSLMQDATPALDYVVQDVNTHFQMDGGGK